MADDKVNKETKENKENKEKKEKKEKKKKEPQIAEKVADVIISQIGDFKIYQFWFCMLVFLSKFGTGWHTLSHIFLAAPTRHFCKTANVTDPCSNDCKRHGFDTSVFQTTIVTEWNLTCGHAFLSSLSQSIVMLGIMLGSFAFGIISDRFGRRPAFLSCCFMQLITGMVVCASPYFWFYCIFRFLVAFATGGTMTTSFVIMMEIIGPKKRELIAILYQIPFNVGHASLAVFAYFIRTWRWFQFSITVFSLIFVLYIWLIPESPRWLYTTGRLDKSIKILEKVAKANNLVTETIRGEVEAAYKVLSSKAPAKKGTMVDLFRTPYMRLKTICLAFDWLVVCMVYYGTAQYIGKLGGNIFVNNLIAAGLGIPGTLLCVVMTKYLGRKITMMCSNAFSAVGLLALVFLSNAAPIYQVICATVGLFGASVTFPNAYLWSGEIFPTVVRSNGMGLCSFVGRFGSLTAPLITDLSKFYAWIPPLIFGVFSALSVLFTFFVPETRGMLLPETMEDGESFGKKKKKTENLVK